MFLSLPPGDWLRSLQEQRGRAMNTLLGVAWGTFAVVAMLSLGAGMEEKLVREAAAMGRSVVIAWPQRTSVSFEGFPSGRRLAMTENDARALAAIPALEALSPEFYRGQTVQRGDRVFRAGVSGVHASFGALRQMEPQSGGRFLNERDIEESRRVVFLGHRIREQLFGAADPVGQTLVLADTPFTVVGVAAPKSQSSDYSGYDDNRACIPSTTFANVFGARTLSNFVFRARDPRQQASAIRAVYEVLGRRLRFDPHDREALSVWDTTEDEKLRHYIFLATDILLGAAGVFTLLVGGIGVGNLMFLIVRRQTREIGLRIAVGARPRWILTDVLLQTGALVALGGAAGFLAAWGLGATIAATPLREELGSPVISPAVALGTIGLLLAVALGAGFFPARRAARLDPVRALTDTA